MLKFILGLIIGALLVISINTIYSSESTSENKKDTITIKMKDQVMEMDTTKRNSIK